MVKAVNTPRTSRKKPKQPGLATKHNMIRDRLFIIMDNLRSPRVTVPTIKEKLEQSYKMDLSSLPNYEVYKMIHDYLSTHSDFDGIFDVPFNSTYIKESEYSDSKLIPAFFKQKKIIKSGAHI